MTGRAAMVRPALVLAIGASLVGCAVMQIDVDVYKGPLANHEDVQTQQFAAMAIGAEPLLGRLERAIGPDKKPKNKSNTGNSGTREATEAHRQLKELHKLVKAVRSLYENRGGEVGRLLENGRLVFEQYTRSVGILDHTELSEDVEKKLKEIGKKKIVKGALTARDLALAYVKFSKPRAKKKNEEKFRSTVQIFCAIVDLIKSPPAGLSNDLANLDAEKFFSKEKFSRTKTKERCKGQDANGAPLFFGANGAYLFLQNKVYLNAQAEFLFGKGDDKATTRKQFVDQVARIATAFTDARKSLKKLLALTLEGLSISDSLILKSAEAKDRVISKAAKVAARLIHTRHLRLALDDPGESILVRELRGALEKCLPYEFSRLSEWAGDTDTGVSPSGMIELALQDIIEANPVGMAKALIEVDRRFRAQFKLAQGSKLNQGEPTGFINAKYGPLERRLYGLADGPVDAKQDDLPQFYRELVTAFKSGLLDRGRLNVGLYTIIEDYLEATDSDRDAKRERLVKALVRFAEKLLFIANHEALFTPAPNLGDEGDRRTVRQYVQILQAVGNSILIQADEQRFRETHGEKLKKRKGAELQALMEKFPDLGKVPLGKDENARDVLDRLIAALRYEHIEALKNGGQDAGEAKKIAAALKVAYEQRAGMAYIRPSASYLRSSFPATSLQDDPRLAWENMLTSHAKRSFSPSGAWPDKEELQRQKINAEIDKQFWQNINSVRVAGAGATNYVIAKDDIGNWYVKAFSADPESIIKSAQQLAMFNLGGRMGTNLIRQRDLQRKVDSKTATQGEEDELKKLRELNSRGGNATLDRLFDKHDKNYNEKTKRDFNGLIQILGNKTIQTRTSTSWEQNNDTKDEKFLAKFKNELNSADNNLESALADLKKDPEKTRLRGLKIIGALDAIRKFGVSLERQIIGLDLLEVPTRKLTAAKMKLQDAKTPADVATAKMEVKAAETELDLADRAQRVAIREATDIVRDELMKIAARRQEAVKTFETSVIFIGGAASPAPQQEPEPTLNQ